MLDLFAGVGAGLLERTARAGELSSSRGAFASVCHELRASALAGLPDLSPDPGNEVRILAQLVDQSAQALRKTLLPHFDKGTPDP